jgi:hypothetical protein
MNPGTRNSNNDDLWDSIGKGENIMNRRSVGAERWKLRD